MSYNPRFNLYVPTYTGQIASQAAIPNNISGTSATQTMARSRHRAAISITTATAMQIALPCFYVGSSSFAETAMGASISWTAAIEYPAGTICGQVLFSGSATGSKTTIGYLLSDAITLAGTIPQGAFFFVRMWASCSQGFPFTSNLGSVIQDTANGEGVVFGTSVTDSTMSPGTAITSSNANNTIRPCAIIGTTNTPSAFLFGDSRYTGLGDAFVGNSGDLGYMGRAMGAAGIPYINGSVAGDSLTNFNSSYTQRVALSQYCTMLPFEMGANDLLNNVSDSSLRTLVATARNLFPSTLAAFIDTIPPGTTSTDSFATTGNQTAISPLVFGTGPRETHNDWRRTTPSGFLNYSEIANQCEPSQDNGRWRVNGTAYAWTVDGKHPSPYGYQAIFNSNVSLNSIMNTFPTGSMNWHALSLEIKNLGYLSSAAAPSLISVGSGGTITLAQFNSLIASAPTTLPSNTGTVWVNGGVVQIS